MAEHLRAGIDYIAISTPFYCNDGNGLFVMHKRSTIGSRDEKGHWDFGSGQLEPGRQPWENALEEMGEEYGIPKETAIIQEQLPAHLLIRRLPSGEETQWLIIPYFIQADISRARIMEPNKATQIGYFKLRELPSPLHTGVAQTIERFNSYFDKYRV